ncbi:TMEM175 family protein [Polaribacter sp. M15]
MKLKHSKNKLKALSDGVFAFAATLMVVNIGANTNITSFKEELPNFVSFGVSFFCDDGNLESTLQLL